MMLPGLITPHHFVACIIIILTIPTDVRATCGENILASFTQCMEGFKQSTTWTAVSSQATSESYNNIGKGMLDALKAHLTSMCQSIESGKDPLITSLKCVDRVLDQCADLTPGLWGDIFKYFFNVKGLIAGIQKMCTDKQIYLDNAQCMTNVENGEVGQCLSTKLTSGAIGIDISTISSMKWSLCRIYEGTTSCYGSLTNCSAALAKSIQTVFRLMTPPHCKPNYKNTARMTVGVYGDPHLRTATQLWETCSALGVQMYFKNNAFEIKGTNVAVQGASGNPVPTTLQSVTVTFYPVGDNDTDTPIGSYVASSGNLPSTFQSGTPTIGSDTSVVTIEEVAADRTVKIRYPSIGMLLFIRKGGMNYAITLRMAETVITAADCLLTKGCPVDQKIDRASVLIRRKRAATNQATTACASVSDANMRNTCEYDVTTTSDTELATLAEGSESDTNSAEGSDAEMILNADDLSESIEQILGGTVDSGASPGNAKPQQIITMLCISLTLLSSLTYM